MTKRRNTYLWLVTLLLCFIQAAGIAIYAQDRPRAAMKRGRLVVARDSIAAGRGLQPDTAVVEKSLTEEAAGRRDSLAVADSIAAENRRKMLEMTSGPQPSEQPVPTDSLQQAAQGAPLFGVVALVAAEQHLPALPVGQHGLDGGGADVQAEAQTLDELFHVVPFFCRFLSMLQEECPFAGVSFDMIQNTTEL